MVLFKQQVGWLSDETCTFVELYPKLSELVETERHLFGE